VNNPDSVLSRGPRLTLGPIERSILWISGALSLKVKRMKYEADRSTPSS
jgi:hypothetical protein